MIGHWLNQTVRWRRPEPVADPAGGQDIVRRDLGTLRVKIDQPVHTERQTAEHAESWQTVTIYTTPTAQVRRGDELGAGPDLYRVDGVFRPSTPRYLRLDCVLLQTEGDPAEG